MIRVTIEVDEIGHDFTIRREEDFVFDGAKVTDRLRALMLSAECSMVAALTSAPGKAPEAPAPTLLTLPDEIGVDREWAADRLNDAWAVLRTVSHNDGNAAIHRHGIEPNENTGVGVFAALPDDMLSIAAEIRPA